MGNFKIAIEAVGNHGHSNERHVEPGGSLVFPEGAVDHDVKTFVDQLKKSSSIVEAKLVHWPDTTPIVDDLLGDKRVAGSFNESGKPFEVEEILQHFAFHHLSPELQTVSKPFNHAAYMLVLTLPRNAERTVAIRKLLEAKDAAVRAARHVSPKR